MVNGSRSRDFITHSKIRRNSIFSTIGRFRLLQTSRCSMFRPTRLMHSSTICWIGLLEGSPVRGMSGKLAHFNSSDPHVALRDTNTRCQAAGHIGPPVSAYAAPLNASSGLEKRAHPEIDCARFDHYEALFSVGVSDIQTHVRPRDGIVTAYVGEDSSSRQRRNCNRHHSIASFAICDAANSRFEVGRSPPRSQRELSSRSCDFHRPRRAVKQARADLRFHVLQNQAEAQLCNRDFFGGRVKLPNHAAVTTALH